MINITVLFFGATAEIVGARELEISVEREKKAAAVFEKILAEFPQLKSHALLFSVNQSYANGDETISAGDELAIFTAVSGG